MSIITATEKLITKEATGSQAVSGSFVNVSTLTIYEGDDLNIILRDVKITATQSSPVAINLIITLDSLGNDVVFASGNVGGTAGQGTATTKSFQFSLDKWCQLESDGKVYVWMKAASGTSTWTKTSITVEQ